MGGKLRRIAAAGALLIGARALYAGGAVKALGGLIESIAGDGRVISATLNLELGPRPTEAPLKAPSPTPAFPVYSPRPIEGGADNEGGDINNTPSPSVPGFTAGGAEILETTIYSGLSLRNNSSQRVDLAMLVAEGPPQVLPSEGAQILIIHTHGSEAYTPDALDQYEPSDTDRTEDKSFNVVRVGDELATALEAQGLNVLHDREIYDYPSYTGSYSRSGEAVSRYLQENPGIAVVIDLHRDALGDGEVVYKTVAELDGQAASQIMMLVGTGDNGLYHPEWEQNLRLALYLQQAVNTKYPTLARPITLAAERYNQHLTTGSFILEVGSSGNTLREALCAVRLYADAIAPALLRLVGNDGNAP